MPSDWAAANWLWGYLIPIGVILVIWGGLPKAKARQMTSLAGLACGIAILGYWSAGFALHMGGAQAVNPDVAAVQGLDRLLLLIPGEPDTGILGLSGFFLSGSSTGAVGLFLTYLPLVITSVLWVNLALFEERKWLAVSASALTGIMILPIAACWVWGSGWLAHTGLSLNLGHGFVDFGGTALMLWLPGCIALGILLTRQRTHERVDAPAPPTTYAPLAANLGALIMGLGWMGWALSQPFHSSGATLSWTQSAVSMLLGLAGAVLTSQLYAWLVMGAPEAVLASRGLAAGWGAILACAPFIRPWQALIVGISSGILFPLLHFTFDRLGAHRDSTVVLALSLTAGPIGLLSTGIFADGRWGLGWNGIDAGNITGLFINGNPKQLQAQLLGLVALGLWGIVWGGVFGLITRLQPLQDVPEAVQPIDESGEQDENPDTQVASDMPDPASETEISVDGITTSVENDEEI